jgi:hypothetical protein
MKWLFFASLIIEACFGLNPEDMIATNETSTVNTETVFTGK